MNVPEGEVKFVPKQALSPTPQLYDELVSDSMENLAKASIAFAPIRSGFVINDNGCGTGAASAAVVSSIADQTVDITIKGTDINEDALNIYRKNAADGAWPAEAVNMDSNALKYEENTFSFSIGNALLFVLPNDGIDAVKEMYRTLKPGGKAIVNSWAYVPNMPALEAAAKATPPPGTPLPRAGLEKWSEVDFLQSVVEKGGFQTDQVTIHTADVYVTTVELDHYANMLWSFIGGTTSVGWLKSDEENWDQAIKVIKQELKKTDGYKGLPGGRSLLKLKANIAVATNSESIMILEPDQLEIIAGEDAASKRRRQAFTREIESLEAAIKVLRDDLPSLQQTSAEVPSYLLQPRNEKNSAVVCQELRT
ncbi:S-adenosyl-L-methionine-dependent methyltransferase [Hypoxylon sp. NC1633]|nr:S-adenosyl-L-methionine-dependent methyltransferase [Hypoxylon sp. NC1633]